MTIETKYTPRRASLPAAAMLAALLLAACSSGHVGETWQCPLAEGGSCDSVAAADPAVPEAGAERNMTLAEPLWRMRAAGVDTASAKADASCNADCGAGVDPLGWLVRLFGAEGTDRVTPPPEEAPDTPGDAAFAGKGAVPTDSTVRSDPRPAEPVATGLSDAPEAAAGEPRADDLRTGEVVARIWIAPFVDAGGVYREATHVRVVLEPAGWRLK